MDVELKMPVMVEKRNGDLDNDSNTVLEDISELCLRSAPILCSSRLFSAKDKPVEVGI
jgi:hypothetical protein